MEVNCFHYTPPYSKCHSGKQLHTVSAYLTVRRWPRSAPYAKTERALIKRPKNHQKLCKSCFISIFEEEIHHTITSSKLFYPGEKVAIGASGGKDSTVLASVLKTLNERYSYGLDLVLLSIDEGIKGYGDDSLETVKRNSTQYDLPLKIVGYDELYGWTMDQVVETIGKKGQLHVLRRLQAASPRSRGKNARHQTRRDGPQRRRRRRDGADEPASRRSGTTLKEHQHCDWG